MTEAFQQPMDELDEEILAQVQDLFEALDPAPADLTENIVVAISLAALDAEIATLQDQSELALRTSGATSTDAVTFTSSAVQLMVSTSDDEADTIRIDGWVTGGGIEVELMRGTESTPAVADAHGRLVWRRVPRGQVRFLIHPAAVGARPVLTPVIEL